MSSITEEYLVDDHKRLVNVETKFNSTGRLLKIILPGVVGVLIITMSG